MHNIKFVEFNEAANKKIDTSIDEQTSLQMFYKKTPKAEKHTNRVLFNDY